MWEKETNDRIQKRAKAMTAEVFNGQIPRDFLPNAAYPLEGEAEAMYFSNARRNMQSDIAYAIMHGNQEIGDLEILRSIKSNG